MDGDRLVARQDAGRLVLEKPDLIKQRLMVRFAQIPPERELVDELIAERREEPAGGFAMTVVLDASALLAYLGQQG